MLRWKQKAKSDVATIHTEKPHLPEERVSAATQTDERQIRHHPTSMTSLTPGSEFSGGAEDPDCCCCCCQDCLLLSMSSSTFGLEDAGDRELLVLEDDFELLSDVECQAWDNEEDDDDDDELHFQDASNFLNDNPSLEDSTDDGSVELIPPSPVSTGKMTAGVCHGSTDTTLTDTISNHNDSGIGRTTDESVRADDSNCSEQEMLENQTRTRRFNRNRESLLSIGFEELPSETVALLKDSGEEISECNQLTDHFSKELVDLNQGFEQMKLENSLATSSTVQTGPVELFQQYRTSFPMKQRVVPRMGIRRDFCRPVHIPCPTLNESLPLPPSKSSFHSDNPPVWVRMNTASHHPNPTKGSKVLGAEKYFITSDYNTGDSCCNTPVMSQRTLTQMQSSEKHADDLSPFSGQQRPRNCDRRPGKVTNITPQTAEQNTVSEYCRLRSLQKLYTQYVDVMYTNSTNLEHTIRVQQKLFGQQIQQTLQHGNLEPRSGQLNEPEIRTDLKLQENPVSGESTEQQHIPMEWVVKRRSDGSRYITRRPVRKQILKDRAQKLSEERRGVTTDDDDAASELKLGRYWSREKRKLHLEKARYHRQQKELMRIQKMETVRENDDHPNIIELSRRKVMRHKSKKVLDSFITVQEMLAHGNQDPCGRSSNQLLSVTTV